MPDVFSFALFLRVLISLQCSIYVLIRSLCCFLLIFYIFRQYQCGSTCLNIMKNEKHITAHMKSTNVHKIREYELEKVHLIEEFDILQIVGEGWFGKILLVEHRTTDTEMVLKALPKEYVNLKDFFREFHYALHLGIHRSIVTTYNIVFETADFYVFCQEYAPLGDLTANVSESGIGELYSKRVAKQLAAAIEYIHSHGLVHRDVKLDNILVFKSDFSKIKLCDMGETRKTNSMVRRRNEWLPYSPPEVLTTDIELTYRADPSHDVWQFAIVLFVCLTGCLPWQKASNDDPRYGTYLLWHNSSGVMVTVRRPKLFKLLSTRAQKFLRKLLEPKCEKRPTGLKDMNKYLDEKWLAKSFSERNNDRVEDDPLCPSMYSFHSSVEEKNKLLHMLTKYGVETTVDRSAKKVRIQQWIQNSVIQEEEEKECQLEENQFVSKFEHPIMECVNSTSTAIDSFPSKYMRT